MSESSASLVVPEGARRRALSTRSRLPVTGARCQVLGQLDAAARAQLEGELFGLWSEFFHGLSREEFVATHLFDDTRLLLTYGYDGELAGFANLNISRLHDEGKPHHVLHCGVFTRLKYDAIRSLVWLAVGEVLRLRLRHPLTPIAYVAVLTSPVAYRLFGWAGVRVYPAPNVVAPPHVERLLAALAEHRRLPVDPDDPWLVEFAVKQRNPKALKQSRCVRRSDPHMDFFAQRAPKWDQGWSLLSWMPMDTANLLRGVWGLLVNKRR